MDWQHGRCKDSRWQHWRQQGTDALCRAPCVRPFSTHSTHSALAVTVPLAMALSTPPSPKGRWCGGALYCTHSPMRGRTSLACVFRGQAAAHWHVGDGGGSDAASIRCHRCRCDRSGRRCRAAAVAVAVRVPFRPFWRPHARQGGRRHTAHAQRWGLGRWQAGAPAQDDHGLEARPDDQMGRRSWSAPRVWPAACCDRATEKRWGGGGGGRGQGACACWSVGGEGRKREMGGVGMVGGGGGKWCLGGGHGPLLRGRGHPSTDGWGRAFT